MSDPYGNSVAFDLGNILRKLNKRNYLICMADRKQSGWACVEE